MNKKLTKKEKDILKEDIMDLEFLARKYAKEKKFGKAADCESEKAKLQKKLGGEE